MYECLYMCNAIYIRGYLSCISAIAKPLINRLTQMRLKADDFKTLNIIGRGAFGEVVCVDYLVSISGHDFMSPLLGISC